MQRLNPPYNGEVHHVMNKSIAGYQIFNQDTDYLRIIRLIRFYQYLNPPDKYSNFIEKNLLVKKKGFETALQEACKGEKTYVQIISYCFMPTHFHLLLKQTADQGISEFLRKVLNGYARYFNLKYQRQGTLWMSRFKNVPVTTDEQLIHVTRYIHLNPVTSNIVVQPEAWPFSSYIEYIKPNQVKNPLTNYHDLIDLKPDQYHAFCNDHKDYQRSLAAIKHEALE